MEHVTLKTGGLRVSRLSLGTWGFSGAKNWGPNDEKDSIDTTHLALDLGVNFMDTAAKYNDGIGEEVLGRCIKGRRKEVVLATKIYTDHLAAKDVPVQCEASLKRLGTDYIDLYQIHWPSRDIPLDETMRAFEKLVQDGKIRSYGVCNFGVGATRAVKGFAVATNQLPYNLLWRQIEDGIIPESVGQNISIWPYSPLAQGLLTGKFKTIEDVPLHRRDIRFYNSAWKQGRHSDGGYEAEIFAFLPKLQAIADKAGMPMGTLALAFLKTRPGVDSVLVGARNTEQLKANVKMFETEVPADVLAEVVKLSDELKPKMGKNADLWISDNGGRFF